MYTFDVMLSLFIKVCVAIIFGCCAYLWVQMVKEPLGSAYHKLAFWA